MIFYLTQQLYNLVSLGFIHIGHLLSYSFSASNSIVKAQIMGFPIVTKNLFWLKFTFEKTHVTYFTADKQYLRGLHQTHLQTLAACRNYTNGQL